MKRFLPLVLAFATGCAMPEYRAPEINQPIKSRLEIIESVLGNTRPVFLQNGYVTDVFTQPSLTIVAGVYAGTVTIRRTQNGVIAQGLDSELEHPEAMNKACREADLDCNLILTDQEVRTLERRVLR